MVARLPRRPRAFEHIPVRPEARGLAIVMIDTGWPAGWPMAYTTRRDECALAASLLGVPALRDASIDQVEAAAARLGEPGHRRARHMVSENGRVLEFVAGLRRDDWLTLGSLLTASHRSLWDDFEVSWPELETAVESAQAAGAWGPG